MKNERARRRKYFREAQWKIAEDNLRILMWTAVITVGLLLLFLLLAKWMLPGWHIAACHMAFFPVLLAFCGVVSWYRRRNVVSRQASAVLSILFECIVFSFVILIDTVGTPGGPGSFMPVVCVAIPAILTLPHILSYGLMGIFEVVYIAAALVWKEPAVRWYDIFGSLVGVICSMAVENLVMFVATIGISVPSFLYAMLLMIVFGVILGWLPIIGLKTPLHYIMPAFSLALYPISMITRLVRSSMKEVMKQDYIVLARSKGTPMIKVILGHALKNCLIPVVTYAGPLLAFLITGSFVIESLFSIPGIGSEFVNSVTNRDYTMIMALTILFGSFIIIVNILTDLLVAFIDPRVKLEKKAS